MASLAVLELINGQPGPNHANELSTLKVKFVQVYYLVTCFSVSPCDFSENLPKLFDKLALRVIKGVTHMFDELLPSTDFI